MLKTLFSAGLAAGDGPPPPTDPVLEEQTGRLSAMRRILPAKEAGGKHARLEEKPQPWPSREQALQQELRTSLKHWEESQSLLRTMSSSSRLGGLPEGRNSADGPWPPGKKARRRRPAPAKAGTGPSPAGAGCEKLDGRAQLSQQREELLGRKLAAGTVFCPAGPG